MRLLPLALVGLLVGSGCVSIRPEHPGATGGVPEARWSVTQWKTALTKPVYTSIINSIDFVKAKDGTQLSLTLHLPKGMRDGTKIPTLIQLTPYQTSGAQPSADNPSSEFAAMVLRGAAYVEADARGTNGSGGCLDFGGSADRSDAQVFVDWIRAQPWSNGVVVSDGVSHPGMGSVVLHESVPTITASLAHAPVVSYYMDEWKQGAKYEDQLNGPGYEEVEMMPGTDPQTEYIAAQPAGCTGKTFFDYDQVDGPFTAQWADRDLSRHAQDAKAPILLTQGFIDENVHPDHVQLYWDALPEDFPKYLVMGYWYHGWPDLSHHPAKAQTPLATFDDFRHRWLDATLFGIDNGLWTEPRVLIEDNHHDWYEGHDWPLEQGTNVTFYPAADGTLAASMPGPGVAAYKDNVPSQRGVWANAHVAFRSAPLDATMLVNGAPTVDLFASSDQDQTKWVVYLMDEHADGTWQRITDGYADSHSWGREDQWLPMQPGTTYHWTLHLMPTAVLVPKGDRLALVVASQDSRRAPPQTGCWDDARGGCQGQSGIVPSSTAGRATNSVHVGPDLTALHLSWAEPSRLDKVGGTGG